MLSISNENDIKYNIRMHYTEHFPIKNLLDKEEIDEVVHDASAYL